MAHAQHHPDVAAAPSARGADKRRHKRRSAMWQAQLELDHGQRVECIILDLSESGAKLMLKRPVAAGAVVTLVAETTGTRGARIAWADGNRAGLAFLQSSADVAGMPGMPSKSFPREPVATPRVPAAPGAALSAPFLRGRAQVLREMARNNPDPAKAATLRRSADGLEAEATQVERQQRF